MCKKRNFVVVSAVFHLLSRVYFCAGLVQQYRVERRSSVGIPIPNVNRALRVE